MAEWARIVATTIQKYAKGYEDKLMAKRKLLKAMQAKGLILYNQGGSGSSVEFSWQVEYRKVPLQVNDGETPITPARQDFLKQPGLNYVGYVMSDMMTERERIRNQGAEALVNYFEEMSKRQLRNIGDTFGEELYVDSSATGNSQRLSGIETMMGLNGTVDSSLTTFGTRASNAADLYGYPSDTYATLNTTPGTYGGSANQSASGTTNAWPNGKADLGFDFYSPLVLNYNSTGLPASTHDWANQCVNTMRLLNTNMQRYDSSGDMRAIMLTGDLYRQALDKQDSKEHAYVESKYSLRAMGFEDSFRQDGCDVSWEYGMPSGVGYYWNIDNMELRSCTDRLFKTYGPTSQELQQAWYVMTKFYGQIKFNSPRFFGKLMLIV